MKNFHDTEVNFLALYLCIIYPTPLSVERALQAFDKASGLRLNLKYSIPQMKSLMVSGKRLPKKDLLNKDFIYTKERKEHDAKQKENA